MPDLLEISISVFCMYCLFGVYQLEMGKVEIEAIAVNIRKYFKTDATKQ